MLLEKPLYEPIASHERTNIQHSVETYGRWTGTRRGFQLQIQQTLDRKHFLWSVKKLAHGVHDRVLTVEKAVEQINSTVNKMLEKR